MQQLTKNNHRPKRELQEVWPHTGGPSDSQPLICPFLSPPPSELWHKHTATPPAGRRENIKNKQTQNWLAEENCRGADYIWPLTSAVRKRFSLLPDSVLHSWFDSLIPTHSFFFYHFQGNTVVLRTCFYHQATPIISAKQQNNHVLRSKKVPDKTHPIKMNHKTRFQVSDWSVCFLLCGNQIFVMWENRSVEWRLQFVRHVNDDKRIVIFNSTFSSEGNYNLKRSENFCECF